MAEQIKKTSSKIDNTAVEQKFTVATLRDNCNELFNCSCAIFDGATYNIDDNVLYTVKDMSIIIDAFKNKEL